MYLKTYEKQHVIPAPAIGRSNGADCFLNRFYDKDGIARLFVYLRLNRRGTTVSAEVDKRNKLDENVFDYRITKENRVLISWMGKHVTTLKGKRAERFIAEIANAQGKSAQLIMAKVTRNFKHGNERRKKQ